MPTTDTSRNLEARRKTEGVPGKSFANLKTGISTELLQLSFEAKSTLRNEKRVTWHQIREMGRDFKADMKKAKQFVLKHTKSKKKRNLVKEINIKPEPDKDVEQAWSTSDFRAGSGASVRTMSSSSSTANSPGPDRIPVVSDAEVEEL